MLGDFTWGFKECIEGCGEGAEDVVSRTARKLTRIKAWNEQRPRSGSFYPESFTITPHGGDTMTGDSGFSQRRVAGGGARKLGLSIQRRLPQLDMAWGWPYVTNLSNLRPIGHGASVYPAPHLKGPNP
jgi:hypothetical protein